MIVNNFYIGQGTDLTGIATKLFTINCSVKMNVYNPATFFGIHVSSMPINLMYSELAVATGELKYYQRRSHHFLSVNLQGVKVPLYGAGASLAMSNDTGGVPVRLVFEVMSRECRRETGNVKASDTCFLFFGSRLSQQQTRHIQEGFMHN